MERASHKERQAETARDAGWDGPAIGLLDLDAFFASVEQLDHLEWRGRPVIVGGSPERRGVVSTASYEARRLGVHSAMPSWQAVRLCPNAIWTRGNFPRYRELSRKVMSLIADETPLVEQVSIDEAFFDITPGRFSNESPLDICLRLQRRVDELGISCSIGLGVNKTVAKIASERRKPHGLSVVLPGSEKDFLAPLSVRSMSGIGSSSERRLAKMGIHTLAELAAADEERLSLAFGVTGPRLRLRASGAERNAIRSLTEPEEAKSVSNERTFARDLRTRKELEAAIDHVGAVVGSRLRKRSLRGRRVTLKLRLDLDHGRSAQRHLSHPTDDEHVFCALAKELLDGIWAEGQGVRLVGVGLAEFGEEESCQLELFSDVTAGEAQGEARARRDLRELSVVADQVRERFGSTALGWGRDLRLGGLGSDTPALNGAGLPGGGTP